MAKLTHYKRLPIAGVIVAILTTGLLAAFGNRVPMAGIEAMLMVLSVGLGTILPVTTVAIQNAVSPHELGTATGTANFFRSLGGAIIVSLFGAIVLGVTGASGAASFETLAASAAQSGINLADVFRYVFAAATCGFAIAFLFLLAMEERPLRSSARKAAEAAIAD
jgi:MFS family permease